VHDQLDIRRMAREQGDNALVVAYVHLLPAKTFYLGRQLFGYGRCGRLRAE
jgi:hypothetical protein